MLVLAAGLLVIFMGLAGTALPYAQADVLVPLVRETPGNEAYILGRQIFVEMAGCLLFNSYCLGCSNCGCCFDWHSQIQRALVLNRRFSYLSSVPSVTSVVNTKRFW